MTNSLLQEAELRSKLKVIGSTESLVFIRSLVMAKATGQTRISVDMGPLLFPTKWKTTSVVHGLFGASGHNIFCRLGDILIIVAFKKIFSFCFVIGEVPKLLTNSQRNTCVFCLNIRFRFERSEHLKSPHCSLAHGSLSPNSLGVIGILEYSGACLLLPRALRSE